MIQEALIRFPNGSRRPGPETPETANDLTQTALNHTRQTEITMDPAGDLASTRPPADRPRGGSGGARSGGSTAPDTATSTDAGALGANGRIRSINRSGATTNPASN